MTSAIEWPCCEDCGGIIWKIHREPHVGGFEDQFFTCSACEHVTVRTVTTSEDDSVSLPHAA